MEKDFNNNMPPYMDFNYKDINGDFPSSMYAPDPIANPMMQYEQAFSYYKYLNMQMEYKIKCKEYEAMCSNSNDKREIR